MPTKSINRPNFKNEAEEADWYHTPEGQTYATGVFRKAIRKGTLVVNEKLSISEAAQLAKTTGKSVVMRKGSQAKPAGDTVLQKILEQARLATTQPVSLRISVADLDAAKRIAKKTGKGYQTVLKQMISEGVRRAS